MKWFIGIVIVILAAILGVMYRGQMVNAEKIVDAHKRLTMEMAEVSKDISQLTIIVTRIDERTKKTEDGRR